MEREVDPRGVTVEMLTRLSVKRSTLNERMEDLSV
jgi:hypothetical protein